MVSIEGEHTYLLLLRPNTRELRLEPIFNCPYQTEAIVLDVSFGLKYLLTYRYMY